LLKNKVLKYYEVLKMTPLMDTFPEYELEQVLMRKLNKDDIDDMQIYLSDKDVNKYLPSDAAMQDRAEIKAMIENVNRGFANNNKIRWGIVDQEKQKVIGDCGFYKIDLTNRTGEISYRLSKDYWNQGIMSKVLDKMLYYGFEEIELNRVEASVIPANKGSIYLLEKKGFIKEGVLRDSLLKNDKYYNLIVYSILKRDYFE